MAFPACRPWLVSRWVPTPRSSTSFHSLFSSPPVPFSHLKASYLPSALIQNTLPGLIIPSHLIIPICP